MTKLLALVGLALALTLTATGTASAATRNCGKIDKDWKDTYPRFYDVHVKHLRCATGKRVASEIRSQVGDEVATFPHHVTVNGRRYDCEQGEASGGRDTATCTHDERWMRVRYIT